MPASPRPRRRRRTVVLTSILAAALVYAGVVGLYAAGEAARLDQNCQASDGAVVLDLDAVSVDAARDRIGATVAISGDGPLATSGLGYTDPVTIVATGGDGAASLAIPAETLPGTFTLSLITDGEIERWPFDSHVATARFVVLQTAADGTPSAYSPDVCARGQVSGWTLSAVAGEGDDSLTIDGRAVPEVVITATRSPATVAFGLVLLVLLAALPVLSLIVAIAAFRGRRKTEATLMSWMGAMLFATIPLRTFLPGSPPVGSWVDYLVVLWVIVGLVAALVIYVLAWRRWTPAAGDRPTR